jgi:hypothetical protein
MAIADTTAIAAGTPRDRLTDTPLGIAATLTGGEKRRTSPTSAGARQSRPLLTRCRASGAKRPSHLTAPLRQTPTPPNLAARTRGSALRRFGLRDRTGERRSRRARARAAESRARHKWSGLEQVPLVLLHDEDEDGAGSHQPAFCDSPTGTAGTAVRNGRQVRRIPWSRQLGRGARPGTPSIRSPSHQKPDHARRRPETSRRRAQAGARMMWRGAREPHTPKATAEVARWTPACARGSLTDGPLSLS